MATSKIAPAPLMAVLAASDIDRVVGFYRDTLGFRVELSDDMPGSARVYTGGNGVFLVYQTEFKRAETTVAYFMVDDAEGTRDDLRARGVKIEEYDLPNMKTKDGLVENAGMKSGWFKDSEGNTIGFGEVPAEVLRQAT